jgi:hypothetical protein
MDMRHLLSHVTRSATIALVLVMTCVAMSAATAAHTRTPFTPQSTVELSPGISFTRGTMRTGSWGRIQSVRVATVWPSHPEVRLRSLLSNDVVVGREVPHDLAMRQSGPGMVAMIATNGDAGTRDRVDAYAAPHSMAISGGELLVAPACARPTLGIDGAGGMRIDDVRAHITMTEVGRKAVKHIHRLNTHRDDTKLVLYTSRFGPSTQSLPGGVEVILSLPDVLRPTGVQEVQVLEVRDGAGDTPLQPGMAVLSVNDPQAGWVRGLQAGQLIRLETSVVHTVDSRCGGAIEPAPGWGQVVEAIGGNHFTLRDGAIAAPSRDAYPAGVKRDPRTNVGIAADGRVLMVTVDGRQPGYSIGLRLREMGKLMRSLGAVSAINLDGGGSTLMARRNKRTGAFVVVNRPSDGQPRPASQALVAFQSTPGA